MPYFRRLSDLLHSAFLRRFASWGFYDFLANRLNRYSTRLHAHEFQNIIRFRNPSRRDIRLPPLIPPLENPHFWIPALVTTHLRSPTSPDSCSRITRDGTDYPDSCPLRNNFACNLPSWGRCKTSRYRRPRSQWFQHVLRLWNDKHVGHTRSVFRGWDNSVLPS